MLVRLVTALLSVLAGAVHAQVSVTGVEGELLENVTEYVDGEPPCDADARTVRAFVAELADRLRPALEAFGFYRAEIDARVGERSEECWHAEVSIVPGMPVLVREVDVRLGGGAEAERELGAVLAQFPLAPGGVLRHGDYSGFKGLLEATARARGYFEGRFTTERIEVFVNEGTADIELEFTPGPRYAFGDVTFAAEGVSERLLASFIGFEPGDPYDASLIARLQQELVASEYFRRANVSVDPDAAVERRVPVRVEAAAGVPTSYSVGGGFSTDDGPRFRFAYENRLRNRAGHQLQSEVLIAQVRQYASVDYRVPIGNPQRDWWSFRAGLARDDLEAGVGAAARIGVRRTHVADRVTVTRFLDALFEQDDLAGQDLSTRLLIPGISWARSVRDDFVRPRQGHRLGFVASAGLGREVSLLRLDFHGKWIRGLPWDARVLVRGRVGATFEDEEFFRVPLSMRFFAGGDNSVRGYDYESLGPVNHLGELIGGNRVVEASVEYEHPVLEQWGIAAFVDSGNAFLDSGLDARTGAGLGARWFSPLGPVRFDVAWPLRGSSRQPQLHISLGPDL